MIQHLCYAFFEFLVPNEIVDGFDTVNGIGEMGWPSLQFDPRIEFVAKIDVGEI